VTVSVQGETVMHDETKALDMDRFDLRKLDDVEFN
jgi:hypothetical protein